MKGWTKCKNCHSFSVLAKGMNLIGTCLIDSSNKKEDHFCHLLSVPQAMSLKYTFSLKGGKVKWVKTRPSLSTQQCLPRAIPIIRSKMLERAEEWYAACQTFAGKHKLCRFISKVIDSQAQAARVLHGDLFKMSKYFGLVHCRFWVVRMRFKLVRKLLRKDRLREHAKSIHRLYKDFRKLSEANRINGLTALAASLLRNE